MFAIRLFAFVNCRDPESKPLTAFACKQVWARKPCFSSKRTKFSDDCFLPKQLLLELSVLGYSSWLHARDRERERERESVCVCVCCVVGSSRASAAAAAKSLQSCPTLCDPIESRPWDSPGKNTGVGWHFHLQCLKVKSENEVAQSCLTLSDPMDCSLPGSSVLGIFRARVLEWGAIAFSEGQCC